jgi:hypothetical protein
MLSKFCGDLWIVDITGGAVNYLYLWVVFISGQ